jgi:methyl-accepting chemotaxis protein
MSKRSWERRRSEGIATDPSSRRPLLVLGTIALGLVALTAASYVALDAAASDALPQPATAPIYLAAACCLLVACLVVVVQGTRMAYRVAGPEHRLIQSLRRVRKGDLAFRVSLRRGDLLSGLAQECNELLDYLNTNPPSGAKTGTDVVDVAFEDEVREATLEEARS